LVNLLLTFAIALKPTAKEFLAAELISIMITVAGRLHCEYRVDQRFSLQNNQSFQRCILFINVQHVGV